MKKIFSVCILIVVTCLSCSQKNNKPILDGLFDLRLEMTEKEMRGVVDVSLLKDTVDPFLELDFGKVITGKVKAFYLDRYTIGSYTVKDITLSFFDDRLYCIIIKEYNPLIEELLTQESGQSSSKYIEEINKIEKKWRTGDDRITCVSLSNHLFQSYNLSLLNREIIRDLYKGEKNN